MKIHVKIENNQSLFDLLRQEDEIAFAKNSYVYFLMQGFSQKPEFSLNTKPTWNHTEQAVAVYEIAGLVNDRGDFNVANFNLIEAHRLKSLLVVT